MKKSSDSQEAVPANLPAGYGADSVMPNAGKIAIARKPSSDPKVFVLREVRVLLAFASTAPLTAHR